MARRKLKLKKGKGLLTVKGKGKFPKGKTTSPAGEMTREEAKRKRKRGIF